jgi:hypothetical protein
MKPEIVRLKIEIETLKVLAKMRELEKLGIETKFKDTAKYNVIIFDKANGVTMKYYNLESIERIIRYMEQNETEWDYMNVYASETRKYLKRIYRARPP